MTKFTRYGVLAITALVACTLNTNLIAAETNTLPKKPTIAAIPYALESQANMGNVVLLDDKLSLTANKGTDLYTKPDGSSTIDTAPRMLFLPKGDFIFSAKVSARFMGTYDGGALMVYSDNIHWAKVVFELSKFNKVLVSSMVTKLAGDDAYHSTTTRDSIYLKIARNKDFFVFYSSEDGTNWNYIRSFELKTTTPIKVGFAAQSPESGNFSAIFSDVKFKDATFKDFWQGE